MECLNQENLEIAIRKLFNKYSFQEVSEQIEGLPTECYIMIDNSFLNNDFDKLLLELIDLYEKHTSKHKTN